MPIDPANASELVTIAREVGAEVIVGTLRYRSKNVRCHRISDSRSLTCPFPFLRVGRSSPSPNV
jgi:hypothetical protein